ncbi:MAG: ATP synthase subunit I [Lachnospiraceae bacterium]|nr:ATP synthase subunit I [Lachnospiraceae bacterium]
MSGQNGLLESLRKKNRTVLEMELGILAFGIIFQLGSLPFPGARLPRAVSLLIGCILAGLAVLHMYRTLDRALDLDAGDAQKAIYKGYVLRYVFFAIVIVLSALTKWLSPLLIFLGYMTLKFTAYLQPLTHKLCNKIFHETDPDPLPEEEVIE